MSHSEKNDRRRPNGSERKGNSANGKGRSHRDINHTKSISPKLSNKSLHQTNSQDQVRRLVEQEGRTARNLVTWSVPISVERQGNGRGNHASTKETETVTNIPEKGKIEKQGKRKKARDVRSRSSSASRKKKVDLRARYWSYLFDNLKRAVDEIYTTCETDESVMECQEVIMMLDQCRNDFQSLIDRIQLHAAFEKADTKDRPQSLAWAVRKLSPGKNAAPSPVFDRPIKNAVRTIDFNESSGVMSWADRVKSTHHVHVRKKLSQDALERNGFIAINDEDGWETVCYNKKTRSPEKADSHTKLNVVSRGVQHGPAGDIVDGEEKIPNETPEDKEFEVLNRDCHEVSDGNTAGIHVVDDEQKRVYVDDDGLKRIDVDNKDLKGIDMGNKGLAGIDVDNNDLAGIDMGNKGLVGIDVDNNDLAEIDVDNSDLKGIYVDNNGINENNELVVGLNVDGEGFNIINEDDEGLKVINMDKDSLNRINVDHDGLKEIRVDDDGLKGITVDDDGLKGFLSPLTGDSDSEYDDVLTMSDVEHQKAISAAIEQEVDLAMEFEKEQELYFASAKEHEEKLERENKEVFEIMVINDEDDVKEKDDKKEDPKEFFRRELTWEEMVAEYDAKSENESVSSWGDLVESSESRPPGRAVQMHKKLSSPSRKRDLTDGIQKHADKQAKAQLLREQLLGGKLQHLQTLSDKVDRVRELKLLLIGKQDNHFREKQRRAEEKRNIKLKEKVRKAQEEEAKVNEIAFINTLEAQNKKMEVLSRHQDHEARLQDLQEERQRKRGEQQAKETAAYERRRQLEAERQARLDEMKQKRQDQEAKFLREKQEKEKTREEAAKEKARDREQRLAARNEALQTAVEQLQLKIQHKQQESTKRHEQMLEVVKEKAAGASRHSTQDELPNVTPYERKKICTLCNVPIVSEVYLVSHLRGKKHQQAVEEVQKERKTDDIETLSLQYIKETGFDRTDDNMKASEERKSTFKKRAKKIRTRMAARGREYEATLSGISKPQESNRKSKLQKVIKDLDRYLKTPSSGPWAANRVAALDRSLGELNRMLEGKVTADQVTFCYLGGLSTLSRILLLMDINSENQKSFLPPKTLCSVVTVMTLACSNCSQTAWYLLLSNKLSIIVDLLAYHLTALCCSISEKKSNEIGRIGDIFLTCLQKLLSTALHSLMIVQTAQPQNSTQRIIDLISYIVCLSVIDNLQTCFNSLVGPFDNDQITCNFLLESLETLVAIARYHSLRINDIFNDKRDDPSQFIITVKHTGLVGIITLLYSVLLNDGLRVLSKPQDQLSDEMDVMATKGLMFLNYFATADLSLVQGILGCEGVSLQFRHITGHILRVCSAEMNYELLHEVILIIGYFTVLNHDNQIFVQSGRPPTLLQKLCYLPFQYFSNPKLRNILFPTLICSCYDNQENKEIVEQEVSCALLNNYLEDQSLDLQQDTHGCHTQPDEMSKRMLLSRRFPIPYWKPGQEFLHSTDCS